MMTLLADSLLPPNFWTGAVGSGVFGVLGILLLLLGYFLFDIVTPKLNVAEELNKGNMSVGVVVAALLLSIAWIASSVVH